jgi:orotidine-5'-phosphate decarboxylase
MSHFGITQQSAEPAVSEPKDIPSHERLIVPLDVPDFGQAEKLVESLGDSIHFYKLGLELLLAGGGFKGQYAGFVDWLVQRRKKVMVDLKIFDIGRTVAAAVGQLTGHGATFVTVHGNDEILRAAVEAKGSVKVLAVTVLTSLDQKDMEQLGFQTDIQTLVLSRARRALQIGCDGVISSGIEAKQLRQDLGERFLIVVPGVRPGVNREIEEIPPYLDDQKRVVDIEEAFKNGADYIVVGRPIRMAPDPRAAAEDIQRRIAALFP